MLNLLFTVFSSFVLTQKAFSDGFGDTQEHFLCELPPLNTLDPCLLPRVSLRSCGCYVCGSVADVHNKMIDGS